MTFGEFKTLTLAHVNSGGRNWISAPTTTGSGMLDALVQRGLRSFTRETYGIYTLNQTLSVTAGSSTVSLLDIWNVEAIVLNGSILRNRNGTMGPESKQWLIETAALGATGQPTCWAMLPQKTIWLYPAPTSTYTCYAIGWKEHPTIVSDETEVQVEDHLLDLAALWCALALKWPHAEGAELFTQLAAMDQMAAAKMQKVAARNRGLQRGPTSLFPRGNRFSF